MQNVNPQPAMMADNSQDKENKEIKRLKEELKKSKIIIENLNARIKELEASNQNENQTNLRKIKELENKIIHKDKELNQLKMKMMNFKVNNLNLNTNNQQSNNFQNMDKCVTFITRDQKICYEIPCSGNSTFATVEEKLYQQFPQYRETNNNFLINGRQILRFKTVNDNNAGTGLPVTLIKPSE